MFFFPLLLSYSSYCSGNAKQNFFACLVPFCFLTSQTWKAREPFQPCKQIYPSVAFFFASLSCTKPFRNSWEHSAAVAAICGCCWVSFKTTSSVPVLSLIPWAVWSPDPWCAVYLVCNGAVWKCMQNESGSCVSPVLCWQGRKVNGGFSFSLSIQWAVCALGMQWHTPVKDVRAAETPGCLSSVQF